MAARRITARRTLPSRAAIRDADYVAVDVSLLPVGQRPKGLPAGTLVVIKARDGVTPRLAGGGRRR